MRSVEQIFFASHGSLAQAMMETAMLIVGEDPRVRAFTLDQYETPFRLADAVRAPASSCATSRAAAYTTS